MRIPRRQFLHLMAGAAGLPGERHTGRTRNFDIDLEC